MRNVDATVVGAVLNRANVESGYGYGYSEQLEPTRNGKKATKAAKGGNNGAPVKPLWPPQRR